jgi:lysophospholipase L1-like esterase
MTRHRGFALLGGLVGVVVLVCAAIFAGYSTLAGSRHSDPVATGNGEGAHGTRTQARAPAGRAQTASAGAWTGSWATAPAGAEADAPTGYPGRSIRNVVHLSIGGTGTRITFSNLYSPRALVIGHASVAIDEGRADAVPGTMRRLTFARRPAVAVPARGQIISDPVRLNVAADSNLLVTLYTPMAGGPVTYHTHAQQTSYLAVGDRTEDTAGAAYTEPTSAWRYVTAVDVLNQRAKGTIVAFGDSITDGVGSSKNKDLRWPDQLARRLRDSGYGVVNTGIGGNQILLDGSLTRSGPSGLDRFRRDVLDRSGVKVVIIDLGVNDLLRGRQTHANKITAGLKELTRQAHARGLRVVGTTLTPFGAHLGYSATQESVRERVNRQILAGGIFDQVVDFDKAVRDPYAPKRLLPEYDSGDGLHPSDAGYAAMARVFDLRTLESKAKAEL